MSFSDGGKDLTKKLQLLQLGQCRWPGNRAGEPSRALVSGRGPHRGGGCAGGEFSRLNTVPDEEIGSPVVTRLHAPDEEEKGEHDGAQHPLCLGQCWQRRAIRRQLAHMPQLEEAPVPGAKSPVESGQDRDCG